MLRRAIRRWRSHQRAGARSVHVCAWCRRVRLEDWLPGPEALRRLDVSRLDEAGRVTHGICDDCLAKELAALEAAQRAA